MTWRCVLAIWLLALAAPAWAVRYGDVEVRLATEPLGNHLHGYTEYLFFIENKSDKPRSVQLVLPDDRSGGGGFGNGVLTSVSRTVEVPANRTVSLSLAYPAAPAVRGRDVRVIIDGERMREPIGLAPRVGQNAHGGHHRHGWGMMHGGAGASQPLVFYTQRIPETFFQVLAAQAVGGGMQPGGNGGILLPEMGQGEEGPGGIPPRRPNDGPAEQRVPALNCDLVRAALPVSAWSDNWLAYTRYDAILITPEDINELVVSSEYTRRVLRAMWRFTEAGGVLVVVGGGKPPLPKAWDRPAQSAPDKSTLQLYAVGFGQCLHHPEANSAKWIRADWAALQSAAGVTNNPWLSMRGTQELNSSFPVIDDASVPVGGLFALMFLFALAIGPANLILLSRIKRRIWMLWTVPLISAFTCVSVFAYMIVSEGWSGHVRLAGITLLDQIEERATTLGRVAYYSPLTPSDGLRFSEDVEVSPSGSDHSIFESSCTLEWGGQQHLRNGWITARIPAHYKLRRSETQSKYRLAIHRNRDGQFVVVNALGTDLQSLSIADETGTVYTAGATPAGQEAVLTRKQNPKANANKIDAWRQLYNSSDWGAISTAKSLSADASSALIPNSYVAVVEQSPFLEEGLAGASRKASASVIVGVFGTIGEK
jgi:hypothetical protein